MSSPEVLALAATLITTATVAPIQPPPADDKPSHRYVVAVGYNDSDRSDRPALRFADDDAARFYELLSPGAVRAYLLTRFDDQSQKTFPALVPQSRSPSLTELRRAMSEVREAVRKDAAAGIESELFFFYAGHGDEQEAVGYIHLSDGRLRRPEFKAIVLADPRPTRVHVVIDACKSYFMVAGRGPGGTRSRTNIQFAGPRKLDGVGYVLSTSNDAEAHEWSRLSAGIFSHEVRSGLIGGADVNLDGVVDYEELGAFVSLANASIPEAAFRPQVFVRAPPGDRRAPIFRHIQDGFASLIVDPGLQGRLRIKDQRGLAYADVHPSGRQAFVLGLRRPLRYEVEWEGARRSVESERGSSRLASLESEPIVLAARGEQHRAFESLFEVPFDAQILSGYRLGLDQAVPTVQRDQTEQGTNPWIVGTLGGGAGLVVGAGVLAGFALQARSDIGTVSQVDRERAANRSNAFVGAAAVTGVVGISAIATGIYLLVTEEP